MTVDEFAEVLRNPAAKLESEGYYPIRKPRGYWAHIEVGGRLYWYSVSSSLEPVSASEVATAITDRFRKIERCGAYKNGSGFEATVWSGEHCYMLGHGDNRSRKSD